MSQDSTAKFAIQKLCFLSDVSCRFQLLPHALTHQQVPSLQGLEGIVNVQLGRPSSACPAWALALGGTIMYLCKHICGWAGANIHSYTHTLRENHFYLALALSNSRMPFTSFTSVQSLHKTRSGLEGASLSGISIFHLIPTWCLLGQKDEKKVYERELPHSHITQCQIKKNHPWIFCCVDTYSHHDYHDFVLLYTWIPVSTWHFFYTAFHQGKKCPSRKAAVRMPLLWVWKTLLRISFKSLGSCSRLMPLICYVSKGYMAGKG